MKAIGLKHFLIALPLSLLFSLATAYLFLPSSKIDLYESKRPIKVESGLPSTIAFHVGDIAYPKPITKKDLEVGFNYSREQYWTSAIITSPAPKRVTDNSITIPWTVMPQFVAYAFAKLDMDVATEFVDWTISAENPQNWIHGQYRTFEVDTASRFHKLTMYESIYGVNLFDYYEELKEFGYEKAIMNTISDATYEVLRDAKSSGQKSIGIPALAGGKSYKDNYLVLPYESSFASILDGIIRSNGDAPGKIVLVVFDKLKGSKEFDFAVDGLIAASYKKLPKWKTSFQIALVIVMVSGVLISSIVMKFGRKTLRVMSIQLTLTSVLTAIPLIYTSFYITVFKDNIIPTLSATADLAILSVLVSSFVLIAQKYKWFDFMKLLAK